MMKNDYLGKYLVRYLFLALFAFSSCSKEGDSFTNNGDSDDKISFSSDKTSLTFDSSSTLSQEIQLTASDAWSLLSASDGDNYVYADWVSSVTPASGSGDSKVTITLDKNSSINERETTIYFGIENSSGGYEIVKITIKQDGDDSQLGVDSGSIWFMAICSDESNYTKEINITTMGNWRLFTTSDNEQYVTDDWVTINTSSGSGNGVISLTAKPFDEETEAYSRTTSIYIGLDIEGFEPKQIYVSQFAKNSHHISSPNIEANGIINVDQAGTVVGPFELITSYPWVFHDMDNTGNQGHYEWVTPSLMSGVSGDKLSISCTPNNSINSRESLLYIGLVTTTIGTHYYAPFRVVQAGINAIISLSSDNLVLTSSGNSVDYQITSTGQWRICSDSAHDSWLTTSKERGDIGEDGATISFSAERNSSIDERSTQISFELVDYPELAPFVFTVTQEGLSADDADPIQLSLSTIEFATTSSSSDSSDSTGDIPTGSMEDIPSSDLNDYNPNSGLSVSLDVISDIPWRIMTQNDGTSYAYGNWVSLSQTEGTKGATITITVPSNQFVSSRYTTLHFIQPDKGSTATLFITQTGNGLTSWLESYEALGKGYNTSGRYADEDEIRAQVLDCDKLDAAKLISPVTYHDDNYQNYKSYSSVLDAQLALNSNAKVSAYYGFRDAITLGYGTEGKKFNETEYASYHNIYKKLEVKTATESYSDEDLAVLLRACLTDEAKYAINYGSISSLFANYGTDVVLGFVKGGVHEYTTSVIRTDIQKTVPLNLSVLSAYEYMVGNVSAEGTATNSSVLYASALYCDEQLTTRGGVGIINSEGWRNSLNVTNSAMIDFAGDGLFPIYMLADTEARRAELLSAFKLNVIAVETPTPVQGVYQYEFWLGEFTLEEDDGGVFDKDNEVQLHLSTIRLDNAGDSYSNLPNYTMWDAYITGVAKSTTHYLSKGEGTSQTNRYLTDKMFMGGEKQKEFAIYLWMGESDNGENASSHDWPVYGYHYFRTRTNYNVATDSSDPFTYVCSPTFLGFPFSTYAPSSTDWNSPISGVINTTGAYDLFNGAVGVNRHRGYDVNDPNYAPWSWVIFYKQFETL